MKLIIAGSRRLQNIRLLESALRLFGVQMPDFKVTEIVSGGCKGTDALGEILAHRYNIPVKVFPANWDFHGPSAGPIRNATMASYGDALLAVKIDGVDSRGTDDMIRKMQNVHKPVVTVMLSNPLALFPVVGYNVDRREHFQTFGERQGGEHGLRACVNGGSGPGDSSVPCGRPRFLKEVTWNEPSPSSTVSTISRTKGTRETDSWFPRARSVAVFGSTCVTTELLFASLGQP